MNPLRNGSPNITSVFNQNFKMDKARKSMGDISRVKTAKRDISPTVMVTDTDTIRNEISNHNKKYFTQQFKGMLPLEKQKLVSFYQNINPNQVSRLFKNLAKADPKKKLEILNQKITRKIPFLKLYGKLKESSFASLYQNKMKQTVNEYYEAAQLNEVETIPLPSQRYDQIQCDSFRDEIISITDKNARKSMVSLDNRRRNVAELEDIRDKLNNSAMLKLKLGHENEDQQMKTILSKYESTIRSEPATATTADTSMYIQLKKQNAKIDMSKINSILKKNPMSLNMKDYQNYQTEMQRIGERKRAKNIMRNIDKDVFDFYWNVNNIRNEKTMDLQNWMTSQKKIMNRNIISS